MADILTTIKDFAEVREALGLDDIDLPDDAIKRRSLLDLAERRLIQDVPSWESLDEDGDGLYFRKALIHYVCYLICPRLPLLLTEVESDNKSLSQRFKGLKFERLTDLHWGEYKRWVKLVPGYTGPIDLRPLVTVSSPAIDVITG